MSAMPDSWTAADYLDWESTTDMRHEWIGGQIVAMAGASRAHNLITTNLTTIFNTQLRERPCEVYSGDMRVQAAASFVYPDLVIACDELQFLPDVRPATLVNPLLLAEVLSSSTEATDRGIKLSHYIKMPALHDYFLVSQHEPRIERYNRSDLGWLYTEYTDMEAAIPISALGCTLSLAEVYAKVRFGVA